MSDSATVAPARDYSETLFLPKTEFPMRAGLPQREPELLRRWQKNDLYRQLRAGAAGRTRFVLHDGPPYANGNIHIGHALNKILKDLVTRSQQMLGFDSNYVPGWDCHGLPIEWKIEEQYRAKGRNKDAVPVVEFRQECRAFAQHWLDVQRDEFKRLGVEGDWTHPYMTMAPPAEAQIAREIMSFATSGQLYRGSKPVMWSVVEQTALAEAEVEYHEHVSQTIFVKFPVVDVTKREATESLVGLTGEQSSVTRAIEPESDLQQASVVIWTTTPWTIPGNRAIAFGKHIAYGLYEVMKATEDNWAKAGEKYLIAKALAEPVFTAARVEEHRLVRDVNPSELEGIRTRHPLADATAYYCFGVPVLPADFVTDDAGTGFVHIAPGHGADDYNLWTANRLGEVPHTVQADGRYFPHVALFDGARVYDDKGKEGDANARVIAALQAAGKLVARGRLKHAYPHSWRSKAPLIFRNTPQWFIAMDEPFALPDAKDGATGNRSLREIALTEIAKTKWVPAAGENRINGMIANRPDWVVSRQRAWGVPITVFIRENAAGEVVDLAPGPGFRRNEELVERIHAAFASEGADAWYVADPRRFLDGLVDDPGDWRPVTDILDVWFDSGSTHAFTLEDAQHFPAFEGLSRVHDGGCDTVMYLEGSDQHRGWFHSSLLESCGTRGRAPFDVVLTHGFVLDERGEKMSKSKGNVTAPQDIIKASGADILRLWVAASDYSDDLRIGPEIIRTFSETYRKLRNTLRWMLGSLHHFRPGDAVAPTAMPELERFVLHRLAELDGDLREAYAAFDYKRVVALLTGFMTSDLSSFYFDIRKDALYCDPISSPTRKAALTVMDQVFRCVAVWIAPILCFTAEEAWLMRFPSETDSVHLQTFPAVPPAWRDEGLAARWAKVRRVRRVVTGAIETERAQKRIGASLEAAPALHVTDADLRAALQGLDFAEICITSDIAIRADEGPADAFRLDDVPGVAVVPARAEGRKCARSWKVTPLVGRDPEYPDVTPRDAQALREWGLARASA